MVHDGSVGVPFYVGYLGILCEEVVDDAEDKVLDFRIAHVEHELCASAPHDGLAAWCLYYPVRMFLVQL